MKLLVVGAKGQVGSALCRLATQRSITVTGLDSKEMDITNPEAIESALERVMPDFIVNAAAYTAVDKAEQEPEKAFAVNGLAPGYLAHAAYIKGIPVAHISTDYVFSGSKQGAYLETDDVNPLGVYGQSKLQGEEAIISGQPKHIILRTSWVFGLEGHNFPKTMLRLAKERSEIGVVADQYGCPTFADDLAGALLALAARYHQSSTLPWGLYHYSGDRPCSWHGFAVSILQRAYEMGHISSLPRLKPLATSEYPTPARRPANSVLDCHKFQKHFPDVALSDWRIGISSLLNKE